MDKGKTKYFFLIFLIIYLIYLYFDYDFRKEFSLHNKVYGTEKNKLINDVNFNAIILGGSNVMYSLSADQMSKETNYQWFNYGHINEGSSLNNYWRLVEENIDFNRRQNIKLVVYSSLGFIRENWTDNRMLKKDVVNVWGAPHVSYLPMASLEHRIRTRLFEDIKQWMKLKKNEIKSKYPKPLHRGDFNFSEVSYCKSKYGIRPKIEEDKDKIKNFVIHQKEQLKKFFPNAKIILVIPSEFRGKYPITKTEKIKRIEELKTYGNDNFINKFFVLFQPDFPSIEYTCDQSQHANELGRKYRTTNLVSFINSKYRNY